MAEPTPIKPYLVKALYDWISDNDNTPHIIIDATTSEGIPEHAIQNGKAIFNISNNAVVNLDINKTHISFNASFNGIDSSININIDSVLSIYAHESGQGMIFDPEHINPPPPANNNIDATPANSEDNKDDDSNLTIL